MQASFAITSCPGHGAKVKYSKVFWTLLEANTSRFRKIMNCCGFKACKAGHIGLLLNLWKYPAAGLLRALPMPLFNHRQEALPGPEGPFQHWIQRPAQGFEREQKTCEEGLLDLLMQRLLWKVVIWLPPGHAAACSCAYCPERHPDSATNSDVSIEGHMKGYLQIAFVVSAQDNAFLKQLCVQPAEHYMRLQSCGCIHVVQLCLGMNCLPQPIVHSSLHVYPAFFILAC